MAKLFTYVPWVLQYRLMPSHKGVGVLSVCLYISYVFKCGQMSNSVHAKVRGQSQVAGPHLPLYPHHVSLLFSCCVHQLASHSPDSASHFPTGTHTGLFWDSALRSSGLYSSSPLRTGPTHSLAHTSFRFCVCFEMRPCYISQAGLKLLGSGHHHTSTFYS